MDLIGQCLSRSDEGDISSLNKIGQLSENERWRMMGMIDWNEYNSDFKANEPQIIYHEVPPGGCYVLSGLVDGRPIWGYSKVLGCFFTGA